MNNEEIEGRLKGLEIGMQSVMLRLEALEAKITPAQLAPKPVEPPPVIDQTAQPYFAPIPEPERTALVPPHIRSEADPIFSSAAPSAPPPAKNPDEMEYKLGINGLLRGGAVVIVCAVLFLVALALGRGWITPTNQFVGEILLCVGFIGLGIWKHEEREDFGHLMVGIGSFGLYASFAGAYAFKHLYEGETLVTLYMLLSLANLGYSHWRASKSFLTIGLIGGLVAAMMPMHRGKVMLDFALHFAILAPCAVIIVRNKWNGMAALMWTVSTLALIPATTSNYLQEYRVGATYLNCAIALYACGKVFKPTSFDQHAAIQTVMLVLTGFFAIGIDEGHKGSMHALVLTAFACGVGYLLKENEKARNATWLGGLIVFAIITPIGFKQEVAAAWYGVEAAILSALALRTKLIALTSVGFAAFVFSMVTYVYSPGRPDLSVARFSPPIEMGFLVLSSATVLLQLRDVLGRGNKELGELSLFFGGSLLTGYFLRGVHVCLGHGATGIPNDDLTSLGVGLASVVSMLFATRIKRTGLFVVSAFLGTFAVMIALAYDPVANSLPISLALVAFASSTVIVLSRHMMTSADKSYTEGTLVFSGLILSGFFMRVFTVAGANNLLGLTNDTVVAAGAILLNIAWTGFAIGFRRVSYFMLAWLSLLFVSLYGFWLVGHTHPAWISPAALLTPIVTLIALYCTTPRGESEEGAITALLAIGQWVLGTAFLHQELVRPWIGLHDIAAVTTSWVVIAVVMIACGFHFQRRYLRYWSLAIFMVTVGKVFLIDLSELDSVIRVLMLMLLGFGMVGGGYWYIVWKRRQSAT